MTKLAEDESERLAYRFKHTDIEKRKNLAAVREAKANLNGEKTTDEEDGRKLPDLNEEHDK